MPPTARQRSHVGILPRRPTPTCPAAWFGRRPRRQRRRASQQHPLSSNTSPQNPPLPAPRAPRTF
eukprot:6196840-Pleurochrysis_carterae.AAC.1